MALASKTTLQTASHTYNTLFPILTQLFLGVRMRRMNWRREGGGGGRARIKASRRIPAVTNSVSSLRLPERFGARLTGTRRNLEPPARPRLRHFVAPPGKTAYTHTLGRREGQLFPFHIQEEGLSSPLQLPQGHTGNLAHSGSKHGTVASSTNCARFRNSKLLP